MAFFGTGVPAFHLVNESVTISLPVPADRKEWPKLVQKVYTNINDELLIVKKGYRVTLEMEFTQVDTDTYEDILSIANASIIMLSFQSIPIAYHVYVIELKGGRENNMRDIDTITLSVAGKSLIGHIPNPDDFWTIRQVFNGAVYLTAPVIGP